MGNLALQILGLGLNGHIGFNEPGSQRDSRTRRVELHRITRSDYEESFEGSTPPTHGLTIGVATILEARCIRLLAFGARKAEIVAGLLDGKSGPELPAGFLRDHPDVRILLDEEAAARWRP